MRIGGSDDVLQIGAADLMCIRDGTGRPYIPGSTLKGRMRAELEKALGKAGGPRGNYPCACARLDCPVCRVFGPHNTRIPHELGPTRIIVRDAPLVEGGQMELKTETLNRRASGGGEHARSLERVAPGSRFRLEISLQEFDIDRDFAYADADGTNVTGAAALVAVVYHCLDLVEDSGLGFGVSKGYGQVVVRTDDRIETVGRRRKVPAIVSAAAPETAPAASAATPPAPDPVDTPPAAVLPEGGQAAGSAG